LIYPRINSLNYMFPVIIRTLIISAMVLMALWIILLTLSLLTKKNLLFNLDKTIFNVLFIFPYAEKLAKKLGISKDKIGNSFIRLNNKIVKIKKPSLRSNQILALLPRCLTKEMHIKIKEINNRYQVQSYTLAGGEAARARIKEFKPKGIIAVACERDLVAGIKDVAKIEVIGLPNKRPEGPCKNTIIDLDEYEKAIKTFLGK
ncbi:MAG: DUF116 domain-containing protein, partial [Nanoarchaeota archaeon]|nr:DUF116 domain-containing protein [Nanoarchaeota archaeon]